MAIGDVAPQLTSPSKSAHDHAPPAIDPLDRLEWSNVFVFAFMHLGCLGLLVVGGSWIAFAIAFALYVSRAFGLTAFYHRYFSHRAFKTSRWFQFAGAVLGCLALQKGPLWWASHHREHHRSSDRVGDVHSPHVHEFWWAHMGWFLTPRNNRLRTSLVRDWLKFPELVWLDRYSMALALPYAVACFGIGALLNRWQPQLGTDGWQVLVWGFFLSTVALYHATYSVNSFAHWRGTRRFTTPDDSRNNVWVAILTLGEGWHNNHHHYPSSARQGFYWWEVDVTYYILLILQKVRLVWNLRPVPKRIILAASATLTEHRAT